jgi:hypothetical protein
MFLGECELDEYYVRIALECWPKSHILFQDALLHPRVLDTSS